MGPRKKRAKTEEKKEVVWVDRSYIKVGQGEWWAGDGPSYISCIVAVAKALLYVM